MIEFCWSRFMGSLFTHVDIGIPSFVLSMIELCFL
jgi:hypothetical protein